MNNTINYTIDFSKTNQHLFNIELTIPAHQSDTLTLSLPSWLPGSYMIRDFAKNIVIISSDGSTKLTAIDKQTWLLNTQGKACTIAYQVYALDHSVRTAFLDTRRAFFNGSSVFLCVNEFVDSTHQVLIKEPEFDQQWQVATGMPRASGTQKYQFGSYVASDYHQFIDCPFEISQFDHIEFDVAGCTHHLILSGKHYADTKRVVKDLTKLCQHHINLFESEGALTPPFNEYWFLTNIVPNGFGGLEHKNSTALLCSTFDFANINEPNQLTPQYKSFLSLASHEYFHAWNVCRIKPVEFTPYDLTTERYTQQLWAYEGITSYYDDFSLYRTAIISFEDYLELLSKTFTRVNRGSGQNKQSLIESSFYTWTKFYQQGADAQNNIVSYYTKGSLLALWLDLTIRTETSNQYSLDNVMHQLWHKFGQPSIGTELIDLITIASELVGYDLYPAVSTILNDKKAIDLTPLLEKVGVSIEQMASKVDDVLKINTNSHQPYLGMMTKTAATGVQVVNVSEDSPAEITGISSGDQIIAIDNLVVSQQSIASVTACLTIGKPAQIAIIRHGELLMFDIVVRPAIKEITKLKVMSPNLVNIWQQF